MSYEDLSGAYYALEELYQEMKKEADNYAQRETALQAVIDRQRDQLLRFYSALVVLEPLVQDYIPYFILCHTKQVMTQNESLDGIHLLLRTRRDGNNLGFLSFDLYDLTTH